MKKTWVRILLGIVGIIVAILLFATTKPNDFRIERSLTMNASPEKISALVADFHSWPSWSPFEKLDPAMKRTYGGSERGLGAAYAWEGNSDAGSGSMLITDVSLARIVIKLDFIKPFEGHNTAEFTFNGDSTHTTVTWAMYGPNTYLGKVMTVFMSMDGMVGPQFQSGLENLRSIAEK